MSDLPLELKEQIIRKHARLISNGKPMFCKPSPAELDNPAARKEGVGTDWKVIYSTKRDAKNCAKELMRIGGVKQYAYKCRRSTHNHYHLSSDPEPVVEPDPVPEVPVPVDDIARKLAVLRRAQQEVSRELSSRARRRR